MTDDELTAFLPLREPTFFILLSLAQGSQHGYAMLKEVEHLSQGKLKLSTGTLYEALARLLEQGLIQRLGDDGLFEDAGDKRGQSVDRRPNAGKPRKAYRLTLIGRRILELETARMASLVSAAQSRLGRESA